MCQVADAMRGWSVDHRRANRADGEIRVILLHEFESCLFGKGLASTIGD